MSELLLKSKADKIFSFLTLNRSESFYDKEISDKTGVSRGATNQILNNFEKNNLVTRTKRGKSWFYALVDQPLNSQFRIYENLINLNKLVDKLKTLARRVIIFGSASNGTDTINSDIDLLIIGNDKKEIIKTTLSSKGEREIRPVVLSVLEYARLQAKDSAFYNEVNKGIVIFERGADE